MPLPFSLLWTGDITGICGKIFAFAFVGEGRVSTTIVDDGPNDVVLDAEGSFAAAASKSAAVKLGLFANGEPRPIDDEVRCNESDDGPLPPNCNGLKISSCVNPLPLTACKLGSPTSLFLTGEGCGG